MAESAEFKSMSAAEARAMRDRLHREGKCLVFTNGCFDLLHAGHVRYLEQARQLGDALIVGLNSDASVRQLKGPTRPLNHEQDRAEVLSALRVVDGVVIFDSLRATDLIRELRPHFYAKGGDYTPESLEASEREALQEASTQIRILSLLPGRSTTGLIHRASPALRLALIGEGGEEMLRFMLEAPRQNKLHVKVVAVVDDQMREGDMQVLHQQGVALVPIAASQRLGDPRAQQEIAQMLRESGADVVVVHRLSCPVPEDFGSAVQLPVLCLHPSLLPAYPGPEAIAQALEQGELITGCTLHELGARHDKGGLWLQAEVPIRVGDDEESLGNRVWQQGQNLLIRALSEWRREGQSTRS